MRPLLVLVATLCAVPAFAQVGPTTPSFSPQLFHPAPGPDDYVSIESAKPLHHLQVAAGLTLDYARDPLSILTYSSRTLDPYGTKIDVQRRAISGEAWVALGLFERFQVALAIPMTMNESGQSFDGDYPPPDGVHVRPPSGYALGDLRVQVKGLLYGKKRGFQLAISYWQGFPTGNDDKLGGDPHRKGYTGEPRVIGEWIADRWSAALQVGFAWHAATTVYYSAGAGQSLTYGAAAGYDVVRGRLRLALELYGHHTFDSAIDYTAKSPLELDASARVFIGAGFSVLAGIGGGVLDGAGAPKPRVFVGLGWVKRRGDRDHDGIPDGIDRCPDVAEDLDGFEDDDGCPEYDNDRDSIRDTDDRCPDAAEDFDGWKDDDGCPDADNDGDGILDVNDQCPDEAEDKKPPYPHDGCPNPDHDDDGVSDSVDECPGVKEDVDGVDDQDGCPDFAGQVRVVDDQIVLKTPIALDASGHISMAGIATIDQLAVVLAARATTKLRIEGYWDTRGEAGIASSQAIAEAVRRRLVERGVAADRLVAGGYGLLGAPTRRVELHITNKAKPASAESKPEE
ncbi:MAG: transporter [Polyangia bacterium]